MEAGEVGVVSSTRQRRGVPLRQSRDVAGAHRFQREAAVLRAVGREPAAPRSAALQHQVEATDRKDEIHGLWKVGDAAAARRGQSGPSPVLPRCSSLWLCCSPVAW